MGTQIDDGSFLVFSVRGWVKGLGGTKSVADVSVEFPAFILMAGKGCFNEEGHGLVWALVWGRG